MQYRILFILVTLSLVAAACAPAAPPAAVVQTANLAETAAVPMVTSAPAISSQPIATHDMVAGPSPTVAATEQVPMTDLPDWYQSELVDVRSGESFTISDFQGKVVLVETLAIWCPKCRSQQGQVAELHQMLGAREDFLSLGLDIDPNESSADLKAYIEQNGFDWLYAVASEEVARQIGQLYGEQFLNPPATPMLIIDRHGQAHPLPPGIKSAAELQEALQPFLDEGM